MSKYTFGTGDEAAARLKILADFFNPLSHDFIRRFLDGIPAWVVDLGCGPGYSTEMLCGATRASLTLGVDRSLEFLRLAQRDLPSLYFLQADLLHGFLPVKVDVLFCRFLLSHVPDPVDHINRWGNALGGHGTFFLDELESIETDIPAFRRYLEVQTELVASQGADLFPGKRLAGADFNLRIVSDSNDSIPVSTSTAATWFHPNTVTVWKTSDFIRERFDEGELTEVSENLAALKDSRSLQDSNIWRMRRLVLGR